jgi:type IV pilus assembly protein PilY1
MKTNTTLAWLGALALLAAGAATAAVTNIAQLPLLDIRGSGAIKPNLMLMYDNSGSMQWNFTPDYIDDSSSCRLYTYMVDDPRLPTGRRNRAHTTGCRAGRAPFNSADFNRQYYNPALRYLPPVRADGTSYRSQDRGATSAWTAVTTDGFGVNKTDMTPLRYDRNDRLIKTETSNLVADFPDLKFCNGNDVCRQNTTTYTYPNDDFYDAQDVRGGPYYYTIRTAEYCTDEKMTNCVTTAVDAAAPSGYPVAAKVRWCSDANLATANCRAKYDATYQYPRFGSQAGDAVFARTNIVPGRSSYPKAAARTDCSGASCSYDEEMTNFANWYAYYKTRNQMMKSAVGLAFKPLTARYRVGLATLSEAAEGRAMTQLPADFETTARANWYASLYAMDGDGSTPTRKAMQSIGEMYANTGNYVFTGSQRVVQYPCQQNYMILTTDGYWNGGNVPGVASNDEVENAARFCTRRGGCVDTRHQGTSSLADIALYWYNGGSAASTVSLRPDLEPDMTKEGQVPAGPGENAHLHVNTYTLGLGVDGMMTYEKDYDKSPKAGGDYANVINGVSRGCPWNDNNEYVWPDPQTGGTDSTVQARVDDLWHAAVNGHGKYFAASAPDDVVAGLASALNAMEIRSGAAAAAATSTPNISQEDNDLYADTFTTVQWWGELANKKINIVDGRVDPVPVWTTTDSLGLRVGANSDERTIYMAGAGGLGTLRPFRYSDGWESLLKGWFNNVCDSQLSQCISLRDDEKLVVNSGANIVDWLRGQQGNADGHLLRAYTKTQAPPYRTAGVPIVLGDIVSSKPAYVRDPRKAYTFDDYAAFRVAQAGRAATIYVGANDGMLHAFDAADNGAERWAYVPRITMKKLARQASLSYPTNHQFTADGSPEVSDVQIGGQWRTVLVAGLNGGGRGYYALDVTDPAAPVGLWELCADSAVCTRNDPDIGLTFGNPQFGKWNNRWVVFLTSGYNNVPGTDGVNTGDGRGYLYIVDVATGEVLNKTTTDSGSVATPSGFARITAISPNPFFDPVMTYVYGGDNDGKMWRFDLTTSGLVRKSLMGNAGSNQPVTTRPEVTTCKATVTDASGRASTQAKTVVVYGTGRMLHLDDIRMTATQSVYVLGDSPDEATPWRQTPAMAKQTLRLVSAPGGPQQMTISGDDVDFSRQAGWYADFDLNTGERVTIDPKVVGGTLGVVTNIPKNSDDCNVGGKANFYQLDVCTGHYLEHDGIAGQTLLNNAAAVGFIVVRLPSGALKIVTTSAKGEHETARFKEASATEAHKVGWRRVHE